MAIPEGLTSKHIRQALRYIDENGVPPRRQATSYYLLHEAQRYPPKYVLSLAAELGLGRELRPEDFGGGSETNNFLISRGFTVVNERSHALVAPGASAKPQEPASRKGRAPGASSASPTEAPSDELPIARMAVRGSWDQSVGSAADLLHKMFSQQWPKDVSAWITITPGGLICERPAREWTGAQGWQSNSRDFESAAHQATPAVNEFLSRSLLREARRRTRWLTIGVDLVWGEEDLQSVPHAELVAVVDVERGSIVKWTGKSYPTSDQERHLIQVPIESHFLTLDRKRIIVLGCHDLNMYHPRGFANQRAGSVRRRRCTQFRRKCRDFEPVLVVQHPHSTDSPRIWRNAWCNLNSELPSVRYWASGVAYGEDKHARGELDDVLQSTRSPEGVLDLVVVS